MPARPTMVSTHTSAGVPRKDRAIYAAQSTRDREIMEHVFVAKIRDNGAAYTMKRLCAGRYFGAGKDICEYTPSIAPILTHLRHSSTYVRPNCAIVTQVTGDTTKVVLQATRTIHAEVEVVVDAATIPAPVATATATAVALDKGKKRARGASEPLIDAKRMRFLSECDAALATGRALIAEMYKKAIKDGYAKDVSGFIYCRSTVDDRSSVPVGAQLLAQGQELNEFVHLRFIKRGPLKGQVGAFASQDLEEGWRLGFYPGAYNALSYTDDGKFSTVGVSGVSRHDNDDYMMTVNDMGVGAVVADAYVYRNELSCINNPLPGESPNAEFQSLEGTTLIIVVTTKDIKKGDEILVVYGDKYTF